jgi:hypothetical protein
MAVDVKCSDFLDGNEHLYARKALRKKIAMVRVEATNNGSSAARLRLGSSTVTADGKKVSADVPAVIIRKLGEFTWDFLLYAIIDFHPVTAVFDLTLFLTGPFYQRRLRRQLAMLTNEDLLLSPGESKTVIVAFRGVATSPAKLTTVILVGDTEKEVEYAVGQS